MIAARKNTSAAQPERNSRQGMDTRDSADCNRYPLSGLMAGLEFRVYAVSPHRD